MNDDGSVAPLVVGAVLVAGMVVAGTVAASAVFLAQRDLAGFCDGAAVAAVAAGTIPDGDGGLAVDAGRVGRAVEDYRVAADPEGRTVVEVGTDGRTVVVGCSRTVRIPFGAVVGARDGLVRTVVARARPQGR